MIIENKLMKKISDEQSVSDNKISTIITTINVIFSKLKNIKNCIIYNEPTFDIYNEKKFNKFVHNDVGFEISQNELDLNVELNQVEINKNEAMIFFNLFNKALKAQYKALKFCSIMTLDNTNRWIFRFHIYRGIENMWINENIDDYSEPLLYEIF